jgi:hypothetical protein
MKTSTKFTITKEQLHKAEKAGRRAAEIEAGVYGVFTKNKVHKSKKTYTRKIKHKNVD